MSKGNFFAIGSREFDQACKLGMNQAVAFLVMARGTGRDNSTTSWSALSVFNHSGISRRRAQAAIESICSSGLAEIIQTGKNPRYKLRKPEDEKTLLWLPNELITGAGNEIPPITKLRESGELHFLQKFIQLYGQQDLDSDGGISRHIAKRTYSREKICDTGRFVLYAFNAENHATASSIGPFDGYHKKEDENGNKGPWIVLTPLREMGLIEQVTYMVESSEDESELIYPINGETDAALDRLVDWLSETGGHGYSLEAQSADKIGIAPKHIKKATMVDCFRLKYRPKTGKTSRWWALEKEQERAICTIIDDITGASKSKTVHIKANQG